MSEYKSISYNLKTSQDNMILLRFMCHIAKNTYNNCLYELRKQFFETNKIGSYFDMNRLSAGKEDSKLINSYCVHATNKAAQTAMANYVYRKNNNSSKMPHYLGKHGYYKLTFPIESIIDGKINVPLSNKLKNGLANDKNYDDNEINNYLRNHEKINNIQIKIPKKIANKKLVEASIIPKFKCKYFEVSITYIDDSLDSVKVLKTDETSGTIAIDLGINNLATCVNTKTKSAFIVDGKKLKSKNQWFNKQLAFYQSQINRHQTTKMINNLYMRRDWFINDYIYKAARTIINEALRCKIEKLVIGYNKEFKLHPFKNGTSRQNKINNQNFFQVPLAQLKNRIHYLCDYYGIEYIEINESYTSKCSFYDNEEICKHEYYLGERTNRGLYKTNSGKYVNADVNGALNILKKSKAEDETTVSRLMHRGMISPLRRLIS